jgi:hypothetical protein
MSLELARKVNAAHPQLLQTNINATCSQFVDFLITELRAAGHAAFRMCKTAGEGQYTPPGFQPRVVKGLDGHEYTITGISHDAIWCDGLQFDTIGRGNDSPDPIGMTGEPAWNAIPQQFWRPQNPPLKDGATPIPQPQPPAMEPYPGDPAFDSVGALLFADYAEANHPPDSQMGRWFGRTIYDWLAKNEPTLSASIVKHRREWRSALGLP